MLSPWAIGGLTPGDVVVYHGAYHIVETTSRYVLSTSGEVSLFDPIDKSSISLRYHERDKILRYMGDNVAQMVEDSYRILLAERRDAKKLKATSDNEPSTLTEREV